MSVGSKELNEAVRKYAAAYTPPSGGMQFEPLVISCVVYKFVFGRTFYRSAYTNMIIKPIGNAAQICNGGPVPFRPVVINADQLMFAPSFDADARVE